MSHTKEPIVYALLRCGGLFGGEIEDFELQSEWGACEARNIAEEGSEISVELIDKEYYELLSQKHTALLAAIDEVIAQNGLTLLAKEQLKKARDMT